MPDDLVLTDRPERRSASWWSKQITVGNLMAVGAVLAGLIVAQTRAEMTDTALAQRVGAMESRLDRGDYVRADVYSADMKSIEKSVESLKDQMEKGFARIERALK